ncbi:hypothetical protein FRC10_004502 [Ceratobasidium sp. 414]|nr:hypothetical protein FRC10_004502 [Ceratobasidium sp. 414]
MPSQVTVGGLVEDVLSLMDYAYRFMAYRSMFHKVPRKKDPDLMLQEIAKNLQLTKNLVKNHQGILTPGDYARFVAKQRSYRLDLVEEQAREPSYPDKESRHARISALLKAVVEHRREILIVTEQAMLPSDGMFPPDEPTPIAPAEMTDEMISSLFSKWPALWLLGPHPAACFKAWRFSVPLAPEPGLVSLKRLLWFEVGAPFCSALRVRTSKYWVPDDGFIVHISDDPPPASTFLGGLGAMRPKRKARKAKEQVVTVLKLKQLLQDVER